VSAAQPDVAELVHDATARIDRERLAHICAAVVDLPSPTGDEAPLARWLADEMASHDIDAHLQPLDDRQANAWGRVAGSGDGPTLLLYSPIDTLTTGDPTEDLPWVGDELAPHMTPGAQRSGDLISGLGAMNPKGHAACVLAATEAITMSGVSLRGDLLAAFGAGGMPTNSRAEQDGRPERHHPGQGAGCSFLLEQGVWADAAVIAKPGWSVAWEEVGLAWCDITVRGTHTYVGARHRLPYRNAIADAARVVTHLESWFPTYTERHTTGLVAPQGIVAAVEAGWFHMAAVTPAQARIRVDLRTEPGQSPLDACRELRAELDRFAESEPGLEVEVALAVGVPGSRTDPDHWIVRRAIDAWETESGSTHEPVTLTSGATDANILRNRGIPTVRVGLAKVHLDGTELDFAAGMNTVSLAGMEQLTRYLVRLAVEVCSSDRSEP